MAQTSKQHALPTRVVLCLRAQRPPSTPGYASCCSAPPWPLVGGKSPHAHCMGREPGQGWEENCFAGGGWHGSPFAQPPPPPPWSPCREGGLGWGCPTCRARGGGGRGPTPTYVAQNDPHVALIILTTHMQGKFFPWKKFSGPKFVFRRLWWQHPSLHKTKGPARKPISGGPRVVQLPVIAVQ